MTQAVGTARRVIDWKVIPKAEPVVVAPAPPEDSLTVTLPNSDFGYALLRLIEVIKAADEAGYSDARRVAGTPIKGIPGGRMVLLWGANVPEASEVLDRLDGASPPIASGLTLKEMREQFGRQLDAERAKLAAKDESFEREREKLLRQLTALAQTGSESFREVLEEQRVVEKLMQTMKAQGVSDGDARTTANDLIDYLRNTVGDRQQVVPAEGSKAGITFSDVAEWQRETIAQGFSQTIAYDAVQRYVADCQRKGLGGATSYPLREILLIAKDLQAKAKKAVDG